MRRTTDSQSGFTLIELMIVVLIIGILISIAVPTFLAARVRAQERVAQTGLRSAFTTAKVHFSGSTGYLDVDLPTTVASYGSLEPGLSWSETITPGAPFSEIAITAVDARRIVMVAQAANGKYFCIRSDTSVGGGTTYGSSTVLSDVDGFAECASASW